MAGAAPLVVHVSPRVRGRGGIESLHELHRRLPFRQVFVALFDRGAESNGDYLNLGFTWRTPLAAMRRTFREALRPHGAAVVVYHNGWGLPFFGAVDAAARRVAFLHGSPAYHRPEIAGFRGWVDGLIGVTPALAPEWASMLPDLPATRTKVLHAPVDAPALPAAHRPLGRPWRLGYAGRLEYRHKRLHLLPAFLRALRGAGVDFRFELVGDGSKRRPLERLLGNEAHFHGWVSRPRYWEIISGWDGIVFFSDVEGGPIAMFEGMAAGAIPFYPTAGGSWGDIHAPRIDPRCHYPSGDMAALARAVQSVLGESAEKVAQLRARAQAEVASHRVADYLGECADCLSRIAEEPRISRAGDPGARLTDLLPLGFVTRMAPQWLQAR